ncbi:hypothetical protein Tco_0835196 [Tanacetum coccineum]
MQLLLTQFRDTFPFILSFTHCGNKVILRVLRIILVILPEHPSDTKIEPDQEGLISIDNSNDPLLELPEFESFHFDPSFPRPPPEPPDVEISLHFEPVAPVIDNFNELNDDQRGSEIDFSQNVEDDDSFTFVIQTFLPFLTCPVDSPLLLSTGSEDTIFDLGCPDFEDSRAHGFVHSYSRASYP